MTDRDTVREIHRRLKRAHGPLDPPRGMDPLAELMFTILSQNTSDSNSARAYRAMRARYPTWEALAEAPVGELVETIRPGGLANTKAPRILAVLREIEEREGALDLSWMEAATDGEVLDYLVSLPGVGRKSAACVLAFSLGRPVIPVDTHVHRVATRLGLVPARTSAERAHDALAELVPPRLRVPMHVALIRHGRTVCKAGLPRCDRCVVRELCPSASGFVRSGRERSARPASPRRGAP